MDDLIPETPTFTLNGKTYELRIPNLEDRTELLRMAGGPQKFQEVFDKMEWNALCRFVYRLLKDKSDFLAITEEIIDDEGKRVTQITIGPVMLMRAIKNMKEGIAVLGALTRAIASSEPSVKDYLDSEAVKKNLGMSTGLKSSTPSVPSTDTPQASSDS